MNQSTQIKRTMNMGDWTLLITLSLLWGGSFFFGKLALTDLQPLSIALGRVGLAAILLHLLVLLSGKRMTTDPKIWGAFLVMGFFNNLLPFSLIFWGQTHIASGLAAILNATTPLFTVLLAHLYTRDEKLSWNRLAGVLAGFCGVAVMIGPGALQGLGESLVAQLAILVAACSYAVAGIYGRRFRKIPALQCATGQVTASSLMLIPLALLVDRPWLRPLPSLETWMALAGLAVLCTVIAYLIYFRLLASAGATNLLLVTFLIPVSAIALGALFLNEQLQLQHYFGMLLIGLGLAAIDGRPLALLGRSRMAKT